MWSRHSIAIAPRSSAAAATAGSSPMPGKPRRLRKDVAARLSSEGLNVTYSSARGKPAEALIKEAERFDARMIVVGNRRMRGLGRVLGSVANSVAHNAPCDVYIAKTDDVD